MGTQFLVWRLAAALISAASLAHAQPLARIPRIGFLSASVEIDSAFVNGLRELGYVEKKSILILHRSAEGKLDRLPELASEMVRLKVDIIVTQGTPAAQAAIKATTSTPIVMATTGDAVGAGLVASLAQPGGNVTGLSFLSADLGSKRLELLKETIPRMSRFVFLSNQSIPTETIVWKNIQAAGAEFGITTQVVELRGRDDFETAFANAQRIADSAFLSSNTSFIPYRQEIASLAAKYRLPVIYAWKDYPDAGGLMSYGPNLSDLFWRAATYVDKILKGTKPADLPIEQPTKFELIINLKTAKQIGLTIPPNVLARADRVIR